MKIMVYQYSCKALYVERAMIYQEQNIASVHKFIFNGTDFVTL